MPESNRVAVAAHLHLMMRRRLGRVTDVEWMANNREYALAMVRLCREATPDAELQDWAEKLAQSYGRHDAAKAPADGLIEAPITLGHGPARHAVAAEPKTRYVASLR
jgi:hypothetical protein